jgi:uncharacterized membrane protein YcaP (DUF421 family)
VDDVLRGLAIYLVLLLLFRLAGKRSLAQATTSDLLLLLVVGEATQQVAGRDFSVRVAITLIVVLLGLNRLVDYLAVRQTRGVTKEGPVVLVDNGEPLHDRMGKARITPEDVLSQARLTHGVERMDDIQYAVLETSGGIVIMPRDSSSQVHRPG